MRPSLRRRLLLGVGAATILVLAASGVAVYVLLRASLLAEADGALASKAQALASLVERDPEDGEARVALGRLPETVRAAILDRARGRAIREIERTASRGRILYKIELDGEGREDEFRLDGGPVAPEGGPRVRIDLELGDGRFPEFHRAERPEYLEVWLASGDVAYRSPSLGKADLGREACPPGPPACRPVTLPDGRPGRAATLRFVPRGDEGRGGAAPVTLAVARDTLDIADTLGRLGSLLVAVCVAATAVSAGALAWIVRAGLRPVDDMARQIGRVGEDDLSVRIAADGVPRELAPVAERLNGLLARLESAFDRERAFSADVAHELRTPLAGLRATLEVALAGRRDLVRFEEGLRDSLGISCQMHAMVENLLAMARCEAGRVSLAREPVELDALLRDAWQPLGHDAARRGLRVEWHLAEPCTLDTDREKLRLVLHNVLGNAAAYANEGGHVRIATETADGRLVLRVSNTGSPLGEEEARHVFERFWRGDAARSATGVHCGLGLALCERLTTLLGGSIAATSVPGGDFTVTLALPAVPA